MNTCISSFFFFASLLYVKDDTTEISNCKTRGGGARWCA